MGKGFLLWLIGVPIPIIVFFSLYLIIKTYGEIYRHILLKIYKSASKIQPCPQVVCSNPVLADARTGLSMRAPTCPNL